MSATIVLTPETVKATYFSVAQHLIIEVSGHEDGIRNIRIEQTPMPIEPPIFIVVGEHSTAIGHFPYKVSGSFNFPYNPQKIVIDSKEYPVQDIGASEVAKKMPAALGEPLAKNEVIGFSPNSYDVNRAIADAVNKLQKKFPANVSATVVETGVVAVGSPVGIAYLYVKMQQRTS